MFDWLRRERSEKELWRKSLVALQLLLLNISFLIIPKECFVTEWHYDNNIHDNKKILQTFLSMPRLLCRKVQVEITKFG